MMIDLRPSYFKVPFSRTYASLFTFCTISASHDQVCLVSMLALCVNVLTFFLLRPRFVVVTGDLTDAKDVRRVTSQQYQEEWQVYRQTIEQGAPGMPWYDMRGNHDCFGKQSHG